MLNKKNIWRITLLTNPDKCNLSCPLCFMRQRGIPFGMGEMPLALALRSITEYKETLKEVIPSTMGEPLLYSHFESLREFCFNQNIPLNLTTNGTFPNYLEFEKQKKLLQSCSDIKISLMGFSQEHFQNLMPGLTFENWKKNVSSYAQVRKELISNGESTATLSLQVTLNALNVYSIQDILEFASECQVSRIKWNLPVFLSLASDSYKARYAISPNLYSELQEKIKTESERLSIQAKGSLFFEKKVSVDCPFAKEVWVYPDGTKSHCPNPENRFGDSKQVSCKTCIMK